MYHRPVKNELTNVTTQAVLFINPKIKAMQLHGFIKRAGVYLYRTKKTLLMMKTVALLLLAFSMHVSAKTYPQSISLSLTNTKLATVFAAIEKQTDHRFVYTREQLSNAQPISISVKNATLETVLGICFDEQPLSYVIEDRFIIVRQKHKIAPDMKTEIALPDIRGKIINEEGEPVAGVTIAVKGTKNGTTSDANGEFVLRDVQPDAVLQISSIGYTAADIKVQGRVMLTVLLKILVSNLDETVVIAYGTTTKRLNTGSVGRVTAEEISRQPVSNPLATLQGRVPGLLVTQGNGLPGSNFKVQIRGQNSIQQGNDPLFIIDGIPFISGNQTQFNGIGTSNPFNTINPLDIESIEILKDADATAIYGSRGANGVILITTKQAKKTQTAVDVQLYTGWGKITRMVDFMNTKQYIEMRKEAFANDVRTPTLSTAYDLLAWDTTRYTDWKKLLIGGTARSTNANIRMDGGNSNTKFSLASNFYKETTVFPKELGNNRISVFATALHNTSDLKFTIQFSGNYGIDKSNLPQQDLTSLITLAPNAPLPFDSTGALNWQEKGFSFNNPFGILKREYILNTERLSASTNLSYKPIKQLVLKINFGYNSINVDETTLTPIASQNPANNPSGLAIFGRSNSKSWIIEPQAEYKILMGSKGKLHILGGSTFQQSISQQASVVGAGYSNDALIKSISGAATVSNNNAYTQYRYHAMFGRVNYNWDEKYLVNLTGRRDGSSRFGPGKRFSNFGAAGIGWIFSSEKFIREESFLSFGKLRASYGITGNDQIGDYKYLDVYGNTQYPYQNVPSLSPTQLFNDQYGWEQIKKIEAGLEMGFIHNKLLLTLNWYRNRSDNQYVFTNLPGQTGFTGITQSFPGVVQNKGIEIECRSQNIQKKNLAWTSGFNITLEKNKLLEFPELTTSNYANNYIIGRPLSNFQGFQYLGVNEQTGVYEFVDVNRDGLINTLDRQYIGTLNPEFYGGLQNELSYKKLKFDFFFQFAKQLGRHPVYSSFNRPGVIVNQPIAVTDRWQQPGDIATFQRYTRTSGNAAYTAGSLITSSSAVLTDASFIRLKNVSISYELMPNKIKKYIFRKCLLFVRMQNVLTITKYKGADPENQTLTGLPPLRMIVTGLNANF